MCINVDHHPWPFILTGSAIDPISLSHMRYPNEPLEPSPNLSIFFGFVMPSPAQHFTPDSKKKVNWSEFFVVYVLLQSEISNQIADWTFSNNEKIRSEFVDILNEARP